MERKAHPAPRQRYGPRTLIPIIANRTKKIRHFGKGMGDARGIEAIPQEWAVLCPNRITEKRLAAGIENTRDFLALVRPISYHRMIRMERGRSIIRDTEYELVADALGIDVDELKLPLLTRSETIQWNDMWGPKKQIEDGGDHDSVLLAAYVRMLVDMTGQSRTQLQTEMGFPSQTLSRIWYAEKPIDRWPDSTMAMVIRLAKAESWDAIILKSRQLYADRTLMPYVLKVQQPRVRYAPEDPDRRAPWTYEADPLRARVSRHAIKTAVSARPPIFRKERRLRLVAWERDAPRRAGIMTQAIADGVRRLDVESMLRSIFTEDQKGIDTIIHDLRLMETLVARIWVIKRCRTRHEKVAGCAMLGITIERLRQLSRRPRTKLTDFHPTASSNIYDIKRLQ